ncbi:hypothetical protein BJ170DRAFT_265764 [Xylariales sp. AK1849]|nr:hypothetical protein BJ170DRAFT_265764 [Xylariales sp. AK1849]
MAAYASNKKIFLSARYSDFTITCHGRTFPVHRAVVCPQSPFFRAVCDNGLKETHTRLVDLPDDKPATVEKFLSILYTGNYSDILYGEPTSPSAIVLISEQAVRTQLRSTSSMHRSQYIDKDDDAALYRAERASHRNPRLFQDKLLRSLSDALRVYVMADKFQVPAARLLGLERFYRNVEQILDGGCFECEADATGDVARRLLAAAADTVDAVYENTAVDTDCSIRAQLASMIRSHSPVFDVEQVLQALEGVLRKHEDFVIDLRPDTLRRPKRKARLADEVGRAGMAWR